MTDGRYITVPHNGQHVVLFVRDSQPEWWQVIARFSSQDRAETYADVENDMLGEGEPGDDDISQGPPLLEPPRSLIPEAFGAVRAPSEQPGEPSEEDIISAEEAQKEITPEPSESAALDEGPRPEEIGREEPVAALNGDDLTARQFNIWCAVTEQIDRDGKITNLAEIAKSAGLSRSSTTGHIDALVGKGYMANPDTRSVMRSTVLVRPADPSARREVDENTRETGFKKLAPDVAEKIDADIKAGASVRETATRHGVAQNTVSCRRRMLRDSGVDVPENKGGSPAHKRKPPAFPKTVDVPWDGKCVYPGCEHKAIKNSIRCAEHSKKMPTDEDKQKWIDEHGVTREEDELHQAARFLRGKGLYCEHVRMQGWVFRNQRVKPEAIIAAAKEAGFRP